MMHARNHKPKNGPVERIRGTVLRITFRNPENEYRVVKLLPDGDVPPNSLDKRGELVLVGQLPGIQVGESVEAEGEWNTHPKHGPQFRANWFKPALPSGRRGIETWLSSGAIKGVGPVLARRIVEKFGERTFDILDREIDRLREVKGITGRRLAQIKKNYSEAQGDRELVTFLGQYGIGPAWARHLRKTYGEAALSVVRSNPYQLAADVRGIGFNRADAIARRLGMPTDSVERTEAALAHVLEMQAGDGHTFLPRETLIAKAAELLDLDETTVDERLARMVENERLSRLSIGGIEGIGLNALCRAEKEAAAHLLRLVGGELRLPRISAEKFLDQFQQRARIELAPAQREAVQRIARDGMLVLTGGPGTGKTTTLRAVIELFRSGGRGVRLAAPTGRAARRLSETTKAPAETIHRLLGFQAHTGRFAHDAENPLDADLIVIDEISMLDVALAHDLFAAMRDGTCLLLVGDEDQLPSVGPGNVLSDIIESGVMPVVRLNQVFRQAESSLIVANAHRINRGVAPLFDPPEGTPEPDFYFIEREEPGEILDAIRMLVAERIPGKFQLDPIKDIQVLTPMRRGELGVENINRELQALLNRSREAETGEEEENDGHPDAPRAMRVGDRVMQTINDYEKDVANGDIGTVARVERETGEVLVDYDGRKVEYLVDELRQLTLAYAVTIHKSQGSEYPAVIIPLHMQHYVMLQRNLIYTALTRGRRLVCMVGMKKALWRAIRNAQRSERNSALDYYLITRSGVKTVPRSAVSGS